MKGYKAVLKKLNSTKHNYLYSYSELEELTGVPRNTIARVFNGENVGIQAFFKVIKGLGMEFTLLDEDVRSDKSGI